MKRKTKVFLSKTQNPNTTKTRITSLALAAAVLLAAPNLTAQAAAYPDVSDTSWYAPYVSDVSDKGLMSGYTNGSFGPSDKLTRGQFATILYRMHGAPETAFNNRFADVNDNSFYSIPISWASDNGIITGYNDAKFGPNDNITREQVATILHRYAPSAGKDSTPTGDIYAFPDGSRVSGFAADGMSYATGQGIISGDNGNLNPQGTVVRAVCATMMSRYANTRTPDTPDTETPANPETPDGHTHSWQPHYTEKLVSEAYDEPIYETVPVYEMHAVNSSGVDLDALYAQTGNGMSWVDWQAFMYTQNIDAYSYVTQEVQVGTEERITGYNHHQAVYENVLEYEYCADNSCGVRK